MESIDRLLELIRDRCEVEEIIDLCRIDVEELVELTRGHIMDNRKAFEDFLDIYEDEDADSV